MNDQDQVFQDGFAYKEISAHMPSSLRLMMEIEEKAQQRVNHIMDDVRAGKTTIEEEILKRGR